MNGCSSILFHIKFGVVGQIVALNPQRFHTANRCGAFKTNIVNNEKLFKNLFKLLKQIDLENDLVSECLQIENDEVTFSTFHESASKTTTEHIFNVYK